MCHLLILNMENCKVRNFVLLEGLLSKEFSVPNGGEARPKEANGQEYLQGEGQGREEDDTGIRSTGLAELLINPLSQGSLRKSVSLLQDGFLDASFFTPDCLYPSQKFHSQLARALWNNMVK